MYLTVLLFWIFDHNFVVWLSQNISSEASVQGQNVVEFELLPAEHILSKVLAEDLHFEPKLRFGDSKEYVDCHGFTCGCYTSSQLGDELLFMDILPAGTKMNLK